MKKVSTDRQIDRKAKEAPGREQPVTAQRDRPSWSICSSLRLINENNWTVQATSLRFPRCFPTWIPSSAIQQHRSSRDVPPHLHFHCLKYVSEFTTQLDFFFGRFRLLRMSVPPPPHVLDQLFWPSKGPSSHTCSEALWRESTSDRHQPNWYVHTNSRQLNFCWLASTISKQMSQVRWNKHTKKNKKLEKSSLKQPSKIGPAPAVCCQSGD